jgi:pilus assembly protein CpaB
MRNKRFFIVLVGALIFGVLAAVSVSKYLSSAQAYTKNLNKVAVAKVAIPLGSKIIAEQIMVVQFPKESTPDGAFDTPEKLAGRVAVVNIGAREPITEARLAPEGTSAGLSAVIPEGYRAMTVKVDDAAGISGFIMPGTMVDVVVTIDPREGSGMQDPISKIVLQNIKVLANGQNIDKPENEREANTVKGCHPSGHSRTGRETCTRIRRRQAAARDAQPDRPGRRTDQGRQQAQPVIWRRC